jgi:hypothetical protein
MSIDYLRMSDPNVLPAQGVIAMFASEYLMATIDDVCHVLEGLAQRGMADGAAFPSSGAKNPAAHNGVPLVWVKGRLSPVSSAVVSVAVQWASPSSPAEWEPAELRIIRVESGTPPLTELLLIVPPHSPVVDVRQVLEELIRLVEVGVSGIADPALLISTSAG